VSIASAANNLNVVVTAAPDTGFGGQTHTLPLRIDTITYGIPMLVALVAATRADSLAAKGRALGLGLGVMLLLTVPAVMAWVALASVQLDDRVANASGMPGSGRSGFLFYAFHGYAFSQPVVAVGVWMALLMLGLFKKKKRPDPPAVSVTRNAPCPCGSGRKYKRCCGVKS
jgi:hypothetical protein